MRVCRASAHTVRADPHVRTHARAVRTWAHGLILALVLVIVPRVCLANQYDPKIVVSDFPMIGSSGSGYVCVDCNEITATLALIGHESEYLTLTTGQLSQLQASGNAFSAAMALWDDLGAGNAITESMGAVITTISALYGTDNVLAGIFTDSAISAANAYYLQVINGSGGGSGGESGGGSGSVNSDGWHVITMFAVNQPDTNETITCNVVTSYSINPSNGVGSVDYGAASQGLSWVADREIDMWVDPATWGKMSTKAEDLGFDLDDAYIVACRSFATPYIIVASGEIEVVTPPTGETWSGDYWFVQNNTDEEIKYFTYRKYGARCGILNDRFVSFVCNGSLDLNRTLAANTRDTQKLSPYWMSDDDWDGGGGSGGGGGDEPVPEPEPDPPDPGPNPIVPDPPDLPEPGNPLPPDPTDPTNGPTVNINVTIEPTGTNPADYTPWLRVIYQELKNFHSEQIGAMNTLFQELEEHCVHLQNKMVEVGDYIAQTVGDLSEQVTSISQSEMNYLSELMQWVVDNIRWENNVNVEPYDDTSLMFWLRRIWAKIGSGDIVVKPTDPVTNWDPWGEWLQRLIDLIMSVIVGNIGNSVSGLEQLLSDLSGVFPFCVPYDLMLFFTAFSAAPAAPEFDVTIPESDWLGPEQTYHVDLSEFDDVAAMARRMEMIVFVIAVMLNSKKLFAWDMTQFGLE